MTDHGRPVGAGGGAEGGRAEEVPDVGRRGGAGPQRLEALSDGVFAIAMTLLVLDVTVPAGLDDDAFHDALLDVLPNLAAYALSFAVIAQFWRTHRQLLEAAPGVDGAITALTLLGLALVALLPFPTALLAEYPGQALAVAVYSATVAADNAAQVALSFAIRRRLAAEAPASSEAAARAREVMVDSTTTALVFGLAAPLAFVSPAAAMWSWLTLVPVNVAIGRRQRARRGGR